RPQHSDPNRTTCATPVLSLPRVLAQLFFAQAQAPFGERLLLLAQAAVAVVERGDAQLELLFLPREPRLGGDRVPFAVGNVDLARLDPCERLRQPGAPLVELRSRALQLERTLLERLRARVEPGQALFPLAHVPQVASQLRLLLCELRRPPAEPLLTGDVARGPLVRLPLPLSERALALVGGGDARRQLLLGRRDPAPLRLELACARLELRRPCVELAQGRSLHPLLLGHLRHASLKLRLPRRERLRTPRDRLVDEALALGERLPRLLELVLLFRHSANHDAKPHHKDPTCTSSTGTWEDSWSP